MDIGELIDFLQFYIDKIKDIILLCVLMIMFYLQWGVGVVEGL